MAYNHTQNLLILVYDSIGVSWIGFILFIILFVSQTLGNLVMSFLLDIFNSSQLMAISSLMVLFFQLSVLIPASCASSESMSSSTLCNTFSILIIGVIFSTIVGVSFSVY